MKALGPFTFAYGHIYSFSLIVVIVLMMLFMSFRLFMSRRRRSYMSFSATLVFVIAQYAFLIASESSGYVSTDWGGLLRQLLPALSFIMLNFGVYRLYNPSRPKLQVVFCGMLALAILLSFAHIAPFAGEAGSSGQTYLVRHLGLDLYVFMLLFAFYGWIPGWIGQARKYEWSLGVYTALHAVHIIAGYGFGGKQPFLSLLENALPVLYFLSLFMILFERVVELLQASYTKSITDGLTGLYNRRYFTGQVNHYVDHGVAVTILFSDIDNFKKLNDTQGHQRGDEALKHVAHIMRECCQEFGICGRYGGEEMVALITDPEADIDALAEMVRERVEQEAGVTVSIGYSSSRKGISGETLLKQADEAMYKAKTSGKNKVVRYARGSIHVTG
ncbi:MAG: GGDEF domain-containing protein [Paenibacillaceae bacterium]|nr:GGDEF domain-containing protein [Paenibacillaceae bacterium]